METGHFYYLNDQYFADFPDPNLMQNKEAVHGQVHDRPCFYTFQDTNTGLYWMIPVSSKVDKYVGIYHKKMQKYGKCDTIVFGEVLGHKKAFLIQNMCPITAKYMKNEYMDAIANVPVRINGILEKELRQHRTILVRRLRSQNFRQIVRKFEGILCVFPRIFGRYDGTLCKQDACRELCGVALTSKAKKVLALQRKGAALIFPDVLKIEQALLSQLP